MTNAEKYLKDGVEAKEIWHKYQEFLMNNDKTENACTFVEFMEEQSKPTLTEDERVILRNISEEYVKVGKNNEGLYFLSYRNCEPNECCSYYANVFKSSLFSFIQEGDEYSIEELLKGE